MSEQKKFEKYKECKLHRGFDQVILFILLILIIFIFLKGLSFIKV